MDSIALERDVVAAQSGDQEAFARLVDSARSVVCSITLAVVRDVSRSEDIAQEVFVAVWRNLATLRSPASFLPWLRQLTRHHAHAAIRSAVRHRRRQVGWTDDALGSADPGADAVSALIAREEETALAEALESLPDETREVVTLYYREGQSARQVGDLLGLREEAVKKRLERARQTLRAATLERLGEVARKTAPGAGFTAAVVAAIGLGNPGTAAAATVAGTGTSLAASTSTPGTLGKLLVPLGGAVVGLLVGVVSAAGGVLFGTRRLLAGSRDEQERRALRHFGAVHVVLVVVVPLVATLAHRRWGGLLSVALPWLVFVVVLVGSYSLWLPRIVARRLEAERREDPSAARRQRRELLHGALATVVGLSASLAGLLAGLTRH